VWLTSGQVKRAAVFGFHHDGAGNLLLFHEVSTGRTASDVYVSRHPVGIAGEVATSPGAIPGWM